MPNHELQHVVHDFEAICVKDAGGVAVAIVDTDQGGIADCENSVKLIGGGLIEEIQNLIGSRRTVEEGGNRGQMHLWGGNPDSDGLEFSTEFRDDFRNLLH